MKKKIDVGELDCANCAMKLENAIKKIPGVKSAGVNFLTQKLTIETEDEDFDRVMKEVVRTAKKTVPEAVIDY